MRAAVERLTAHIALGLARHAGRHQHLAVEGAFSHRVVAVIGQIDRVVRAHMDTVRAVEHPFAPGAQQIAIGIKHCNRVLAAIEGIDPILPVDADRRAVTQRDFFRQFRPTLVDLEGEFPASELNRHAPLPCALGWPRAIIDRETQIRRAASAGLFLWR